MRDRFGDYYTPEDDVYESFLTSGHIILDTNVLLAPYRVDVSTKGQIFTILESLRERIWIPYHAGWEFFQNRPNVIAGEDKVYQILENMLRDCSQKVTAHFDKLKQHPIVTQEVRTGITRHIEDALAIATGLSSEKGDALEMALHADSILAKWEEILTGRIGSEPSKEERKQNEAEAERRYEANIPPGFRDSSKPSNQFGDALIWLQILDRVKEDPRPVLLVTEDVKDDWYRRHSGKTIGPRVELVEEIRRVAGVTYYQQPLGSFLKRSAAFLKKEISPQAIEQVYRMESIDARRREEEALAILKDILPVGSAEVRDPDATQEKDALDLIADTPMGRVGVEVLSTRGVVSAPSMRRLPEFVQRANVRALFVVSMDPLSRPGRDFLRDLERYSGITVGFIHWSSTEPEGVLTGGFYGFLDRLRSGSNNKWKS
jgi:hypothetical protein